MLFAMMKFASVEENLSNTWSSEEDNCIGAAN